MRLIWVLFLLPTLLLAADIDATKKPITSVTSSNIIGNIQGSQITSLPTTKLTGSITSAQITSLATSKLTGALTISGSSIVVYKYTDQSLSTTTLANDNALTFPVAAFNTYEFTFTCLVATAGVLEGIKASINGPANTSNLFANVSVVMAGVLGVSDVISSYNSTQGVTVGIGSSTMTVTGTVEIGDTAGNLVLRWAQNAGAGLSATVIKRGSRVVAHKF